MNRKQKIIISITGIFIILLALVGLTYAYFLTRITGNTKDKSISVTTANLILEYKDSDAYIIGEGEIIEPGTTFKEKVFTVTNKGNATIDSYAVILDEVKKYYTNEFTNEDDVVIPALTETEFNRPEDFEIVITCKNQDNKDCNGYTGTLPMLTDATNEEIKYLSNGILLTNKIEVGETHTYKAVLTYKNPDENQSSDMNKTLEGKFNIIDASNTIDVTGYVTGHTTGDVVQTNSIKRTSQINADGSYRIVGLEQGNHKIKVVKGEIETEISSLTIVKGETANVDTTNKVITITDDSRSVKLDIDATNKEIELGTEITEIEKTLTEVIMAAARITKNTTTPTFSNAATTEEGMYKATDDYGDSWYFRGAQPYNHINFAGFMWRIVRINGDGSIRLILDGTLDKVKREGLDQYAGSLSAFNSNSDDNADIGYMYGLTGAKEYNCVIETNGVKSIDTSVTSESACTNGEWLSGYDVAHMNLNDSAIKKELDKFYETYIESGTYHYEEYLADTIFCNDKTVSSGPGYGRESTEYSAFHSLDWEGEKHLNPTLECAKGANNAYSRFTSNLETSTKTSKDVNINNDLKHPIALLSADELVMAGAAWDTNESYYLYDAYKNGTSNDFWWTASPHAFGIYSSDVGMFVSSATRSSLNDNLANTSSGVRPVINLRADVLYDSGDGTSGSGAYTVKLPN